MNANKYWGIVSVLQEKLSFIMQAFVLFCFFNGANLNLKINGKQKR